MTYSTLHQLRNAVDNSQAGRAGQADHLCIGKELLDKKLLGTSRSHPMGFLQGLSIIEKLGADPTVDLSGVIGSIAALGGFRVVPMAPAAIGGDLSILAATVGFKSADAAMSIAQAVADDFVSCNDFKTGMEKIANADAMIHALEKALRARYAADGMQRGDV